MGGGSAVCALSPFFVHYSYGDCVFVVLEKVELMKLNFVQRFQHATLLATDSRICRRLIV